MVPTDFTFAGPPVAFLDAFTAGRHFIVLVARATDGELWMRRSSGDAGWKDPWQKLYAACATDNFAVMRIDRWAKLCMEVGATSRFTHTLQCTDFVPSPLQKGAIEEYASVRGSRPALLYHQYAGWWDVYARGENNGLWMRRINTGADADWQFMGGDWVGAPAAAEFPGPYLARTAVFLRSRDNQLWYQRSLSAYNESESWSDPVRIGGTMDSDPAVTTIGDRHMHVFYRGTDAQVWHTWGDPTINEWYGVQPLGGALPNGFWPAVVSSAPDCIDLFYNDRVGQVRGKRWNGREWSAEFGLNDPKTP